LRQWSTDSTENAPAVEGVFLMLHRAEKAACRIVPTIVQTGQREVQELPLRAFVWTTHAPSGDSLARVCHDHRCALGFRWITLTARGEWILATSCNKTPVDQVYRIRAFS
jgi:hypothetical protein